jgi:hypothetical protein
MEYPAPGLYLHLDLSVRAADDHVAYRTMPALFLSRTELA